MIEPDIALSYIREWNELKRDLAYIDSLGNVSEYGVLAIDNRMLVVADILRNEHNYEVLTAKPNSVRYA